MARLGALVGFFMAINVTLSVLRVPNEWPWTYFMLIGYGLLFLSLRSGRSLGVDALIHRWLARRPSRGRLVKLLAWLI